MGDFALLFVGYINMSCILTGLSGIAMSIGISSIGVRMTTANLQFDITCLHFEFLVPELCEFSVDPVIGEASLVPFAGLVRGSVLVIKSCDDVGDKSENVQKIAHSIAILPSSFTKT